MARPISSWILGLSAGVTAFAIVTPPIHVLGELAKLAGLELGGWDNPAGVVIFLIATVAVGVIPWGLWIALTDARGDNTFNNDREAYHYILSATGSFVTLALLAGTRLQPVYEQFRWFLSPALFVCAVVLVRWRWNHVWRFPTQIGVRGVLSHALGGDNTP